MDVAHTMKAFGISRYGGNDLVQAMELPRPQPGPEDVLIEVHAASVNPVDFKIRDGGARVLLPYAFPLVLGNDLSGVIVDVGSEVRAYRPGEEVYVRLDKRRIGAFAEFVLARQQDVALKPRNLSHQEAASIPLVGLTAWQALVDLGSVTRGHHVLIHAGSGGLGTFAIQLAKHLGATVSATCSTPNVEMVRRLGADVVVDYRHQRFEQELRDVDVALDSLGGETCRKTFQVMRRGGMLITVTNLPTAAYARETKMGMGWVALFGLLNLGTWRLSRAHDVDYRFLFMRPNGEQLARIAELIERGIIRPVVDKVFSFEETPKALAYVETGRARGKVVIRVR
ncbi:MAG: NADP-dependent oxidoreductase [Myxococcota bacterium]